MIDIVDPRTGEILDTDCIPGLAQAVELQQEQIRTLYAELQRLAESRHDGSGPSPFAWQRLGARAAELQWQQLTEWVGWLRGRYPVARQVPPCWWRHPELVEELTALWLAWREAYVDGVSSLTAAADWHDRWLPGLLRRIGAGGWNVACDADHKERVARLYDGSCVDDEDAFAEHVAADVERRRGRILDTIEGKEGVMEQVDTTQMADALRSGEARQIGSLPGSPVSYRGQYWRESEHGWTLVDDPDTVEFLKDAERRLQLADEAVDRQADESRPDAGGGQP